MGKTEFVLKRNKKRRRGKNLVDEVAAKGMKKGRLDKV